MTGDQDDLWRRLGDLTAADREHSHVSGETFSKLNHIVTALIETAPKGEVASAPTQMIARLAIERLEPDELEGIIQDWLEGRTYSGML